MSSAKQIFGVAGHDRVCAMKEATACIIASGVESGLRGAAQRSIPSRHLAVLHPKLKVGQTKWENTR
jgi:hypothetical protein